MMDDHRKKELIDSLKVLAPNEGYNVTALSGVRVLRSNRKLSRTPVLYDPGIVFVCQGSKRGFFGDTLYLYDKNHYLAVATPVPFTMESVASVKSPLLALYIHLDFTLASGLITELNKVLPPKSPALLRPDHIYSVSEEEPVSMMSSRMDADMYDALWRFVQVLGHPLEVSVLGRDRLRELYFRVLMGPQGGAIRAALSMQGKFGAICKIIQFVHAHYNSPLDISGLAKQANMSVPAFHANFKAVTQTSPIQYVKSLRLHSARLLMLRQNLTSLAASFKVGYESPSQFNREFKRLFGLPPQEEIKRMKNAYLLPSAQENSGFISSH